MMKFFLCLVKHGTEWKGWYRGDFLNPHRVRRPTGVDHFNPVRCTLALQGEMPPITNSQSLSNREESSGQATPRQS